MRSAYWPRQQRERSSLSCRKRCMQLAGFASVKMLRILAMRTWQEHGAHNWDKCEALCRVSTQLAKSSPKEIGVDLRNAAGLTALMSTRLG